MTPMYERSWRGGWGANHILTRPPGGARGPHVSTQKTSDAVEMVKKTRPCCKLNIVDHRRKHFGKVINDHIMICVGRIAGLRTGAPRTNPEAGRKFSRRACD